MEKPSSLKKAKQFDEKKSWSGIKSGLIVGGSILAFVLGISAITKFSWGLGKKPITDGEAREEGQDQKEQEEKEEAVAQEEQEEKDRAEKERVAKEARERAALAAREQTRYHFFVTKDQIFQVIDLQKRTDKDPISRTQFFSFARTAKANSQSLTLHFAGDAYAVFVRNLKSDLSKENILFTSSPE